MDESKRVTAGGVAREFVERMGRPPTLVARGPGRVNLIGEHTDYNEGWVLPVAIDRAAYVAAAPRPDRLLHVWASHYQTDVTLDLDRAAPGMAEDWAVYVLGMAAMIEHDGYTLRGADLVIDGDVPNGAGLSSSAALENAVGVALVALAGVDVPPVRLAQLGQQTEHQYAGVMSGIMDQMISALGQSKHALLIDCRSFDYRPVPVPSDVRIVVCDSKVSRELAASAYNERRAQCEAAVARLKSVLPAITALRDVTPEQLEAHKALLDDVVWRRARHVVTENSRTLRGAKQLEDGDVASFGALMNESHRSLRDDYEVSSAQLDVLVAAAQGAPGVYGSRLTGAGFGGCTVSLVAPDAVQILIATVTSAYQDAFDQTPEVYVCEATDGARIVEAGSSEEP